MIRSHGGFHAQLTSKTKTIFTNQAKQVLFLLLHVEHTDCFSEVSKKAVILFFLATLGGNGIIYIKSACFNHVLSGM
jgi:hypothetical protein